MANKHSNKLSRRQMRLDVPDKGEQKEGLQGILAQTNAPPLMVCIQTGQYCATEGITQNLERISLSACL
jgi:hypothetical protein